MGKNVALPDDPDRLNSVATKTPGPIQSAAFRTLASIPNFAENADAQLP